MSLALIATQWTTPLAAAARPWILWADWQDMIPYLDVFSVRISDPGGSAPATMMFSLIDKTNTVGSLIAQNQRIMYVETAPNGGSGRIVYHGFIKYIRPVLTSTFARWDIVCADTSEFLDWSPQIENNSRPAETAASRLGAILSGCTWSSMLGGGFATLPSLVAAATISHASVRTAIEDCLKATGLVPVGYYVDKLGYLHVYQSADNGSAPYAISDTPNYTTTIPAKLEPEYDGSTDADATWVNGGSAAGTGPVMTTSAPRFPHRVATIDDPSSTSATSRANIGATDLAIRQAIVSVQVTINGDQQHGGFDGWEKGQSLNITNGALGWSAKAVIIQGIDVSFKNGAGLRQYVLTCGVRTVMRRSFHGLVKGIQGRSSSRPITANGVGGRGPSAPKGAG